MNWQEKFPNIIEKLVSVEVNIDSRKLKEYISDIENAAKKEGLEIAREIVKLWRPYFYNDVMIDPDDKKELNDQFDQEISNLSS